MSTKRLIQLVPENYFVKKVKAKASYLSSLFLAMGVAAVPIHSVAQSCDGSMPGSVGVRAYIEQIHIFKTTDSQHPEPGPEDEDEFRIRIIGYDPNLRAID